MAYAAFGSYRDAPTPRPAPEVFAFLHGLRPAEVLFYAKTYHWIKRVVSYDEHFRNIRERFKALAIKESVQEIEEEQRAIMRTARSALQIEMQKALETAQASDRATMKTADLLKLVKIVIEMDRLLLGKATQIVESSVDYAAMSEEDFKKLEDLDAKYGKT